MEAVRRGVGPASYSANMCMNYSGEHQFSMETDPGLCAHAVRGKTRVRAVGKSSKQDRLVRSLRMQLRHCIVPGVDGPLRQMAATPARCASLMYTSLQTSLWPQ